MIAKLMWISDDGQIYVDSERWPNLSDQHLVGFRMMVEFMWISDDSQIYVDSK
jgi:hypothetical protein